MGGMGGRDYPQSSDYRYPPGWGDDDGTNPPPPKRSKPSPCNDYPPRAAWTRGPQCAPSQSQYQPRSKPQSRKHHPRSRPSPIPVVTRPLEVTLRDLHNGVVKHLKVTRQMLDGTFQEKLIELNIIAGWKSGTKVKFPGAGNELPGGRAEDLVFIIEEKPDDVWTRVGNDLVCDVDVSLVDVLDGAKKTIKLLSGRKMHLTVPGIVAQHGQETIVLEEGMPIRKNGAPSGKGDLIVRWSLLHTSPGSNKRKR